MEKMRSITMVDKICAVLLALVFNLNAMSIIYVSMPSAVTYAVFVAFCLSVMVSNSRKSKIMINVPICFTLLLFLAWSFATMYLFGTKSESRYLKFIICLMVAWFASTISVKTRLYAIRVSTLISTLYGVYVLSRNDYIYRRIISTHIRNRLDVTLPIGLGLMFALVGILISRETRLLCMYYIMCAAVQTVALLSFAARGNLIFPFATFLVLLFTDSRLNRRKVFQNLLLILGAAIAFVFLFYRYANSRLVTRMMRLFMETEEEGRVSLYKSYITSIIQHTYFLIGSGFGSSAQILENLGYLGFRYPHNLFLELIGEGGVFGISFILVVIVELQKKYKRIIREIRNINWDPFDAYTQHFYLISGGLLFYLMSYSKSYSIYNGYQLFIFIGMVLSCYSRMREC